MNENEKKITKKNKKMEHELKLNIQVIGSDRYSRTLKNHKKVHVCDTTILKWATPIFKNPKESILQIPTQICDAEGKHLQLKNNEFVSLVQTLNNFVPSISSASDRYVCFDNLFKADFILNPRM